MVGGLRLHYLRHGRRSTVKVVIVPGITSPAVTWDSFAAKLGADCEVYILGVRGRGLSDRPASGYALADYAADLAGFLKNLDLGGACIVGHSMGARIGAKLGVLYPALRGPLMLVEPPLSGPGRGPYPTTLQQLLDPIRASKAGDAFEEVRRANPAWGDDENRIRAEWLATCDEAAVTESYRGFHEEDFFSLWKALLPRVLLVNGAQSPVVTEENIQELRAINARAKFATVSSAGHMIPWDNPGELLNLIRNFVRNQTAVLNS